MALSVQQRRTVAIVVGLVVAVIIAGIAAILVLGGGSDGGASRTVNNKDETKEISLLDGKLLVDGRPGWSTLDSAPEAATLNVGLVGPPGRELLATLVATTVPGGGSLERTLTVDGGTRFEVKGRSGILQATAVPGSVARVVVGFTNAKTNFFLSLSIAATDGKPLEVPALKALFTEQVAPALRFPV